MTYTAYDTSLELGMPIELYEFVQGTQAWHMASGSEDVLIGGTVYTSSTVKGGRIKQSTDAFKDGLTLTFPRDDLFASQFIGFSPEEVTTLTLRRGHYGDPDSEFIVYWKGRVAGAKTSGNEITVECESVFTSIRRPGLRARFEYGCRHTLYGRGCRADREPMKLTGIVQSISGGLAVTVTGAATQAAGFYTGGMLIAPSGAARFITAHASDIVTLSRPISSLVGGASVILYPGCDHLKETCNIKFNNLANFGGFPFIPGKNPFGGSSIV